MPACLTPGVRARTQALEREREERKQLRADFMEMQMELYAQARRTTELTRELIRTREIMAEKLQRGVACVCAGRAAAPGQAQQPPRAKRKSTDQVSAPLPLAPSLSRRAASRTALPRPAQRLPRAKHPRAAPRSG
jgi:hypothetical protein